MISIGDALFTKTQQRVMGILYGNPKQSYFLNEIVRMADVGKGSVVRELRKMKHAQLLTVRKMGNQTHYQANPGSPVYRELTRIVQNTFGIEKVIKNVLEPIQEEIEIGFIFASDIDHHQPEKEEIELVLVSDRLTEAEVRELLEPLEKTSGKLLQLRMLTARGFTQRLRNNREFASRVRHDPKYWLFNPDSLG